MKRLILISTALILIINSQAQIPKYSIHLTGDVYGKRDTRESSNQCSCTLQDVINNNNSTYTDLPNARNFILRHLIADPSTMAIHEFDGTAYWYAGTKIFDCGFDLASSTPSMSYLYLYDAAGVDTQISLQANGTIRMADQSASGFKWTIESGILPNDITNTASYRSGQLAVDGDGINPTVVLGPASGAGVLVSIVGDDKKGVITFKTGLGGIVGNLLTLTFNHLYNSNVIATCFPVDDLTAQFFYAQGYYAVSNFNNHFDIYNFTLASPITAGLIFKIGYIVQR